MGRYIKMLENESVTMRDESRNQESEHNCNNDFSYDFSNISEATEFQSDVLKYIAGNVQKRIAEKTSCKQCLASLVNGDEQLDATYWKEETLVAFTNLFKI